jgi:hypothetical protein
MRQTVQKLIKKGKSEYVDMGGSRNDWVKSNFAQVVAVVCNIIWTWMVSIFIYLYHLVNYFNSGKKLIFLEQ